MSYQTRTMKDLMAHHLVFTLFLFAIFAANHACDQNDQASLLSLPFNTSSPPLNWSSIDCCHWEGISCDQNSKVTRIWLPSRQLKGSVSPFLGNLTRLTHLNLSHNSFSGALPVRFFSFLNQLKILDLSYNYMSGDLSLAFSSNGSSAGWPTSIQILDMSSNNFNGMLQSSFLQRAWNLIKLNVSNNSFTGPIPSSLCINSPFVRLLDFSRNHYSGQIPNGLGGCFELKVLRAGFNSLSGVLPHDIHSATRLEEISLPFNNLSGPISSDIVNLTKLMNLELYSNKFSGKLPANIGRLSKLKNLLLDTNSLTGSLPLSLMNCTNLTKLNLWFNSFEGNISTFNFSGLRQLEILDMGRNNFTGSLPISLYSCKSLRAIRLSRNQIGGQILPEILQLKFLSFLSLGTSSLTNITGAIKNLMGCKNLNVLILADNFWHEAIPGDDKMVGYNGFENLRLLSFTHCQLTGQFPIWLTKLKKLQVLDLSYNRITGSIPGSLSTLPELFLLDLSNNFISGEFPKELCELPALVSKQDRALLDRRSLDLPIFIYINGIYSQYNYLTNMPPTISVGNNCLIGNIPLEIGRLQLIHILIFGHNNFSGKIPDQLSKLTNLEKLDLSANQLSGEIPASLSSLHFLSRFSVADNNLDGPIPLGTQLQSFGASAYEGNPELCGPPLPNGCADIVSSNVDEDIQDDEDWFGMPLFPIIVVLGFVTGFWGVLGPLLLSYTWRVAYFQFLDNVKKRLYVTLGMCFTGLHKRF
jgi:Leucine-rich repeat (LRR) protein